MSLHHVQPAEIVHLGQTAQSEPRNQALIKTSQFEAIRLSLAAGECIPKHDVAGFATVQCLHGSVEIAFSDTAVTMSSGDWLYLDRGQRHSITAIDDAALLVTIMLND